MNGKNDILEELRSMGSPLAGMPRGMPYAVPQGYFDTISGTVHATLTSLNQPESIPEWGKKMPYAVPKGYFEQLTGSIVSSAIGASAGSAQDMPFITPAGYFENLPEKMLAAAKAADNADKKPKLITLEPRRLFRSVQWAAAAIFIIFIGIGSYITFFNAPAGNPEMILASVPGNEINDYLRHTYRIDMDLLEGNSDLSTLQLDDKEIIAYLNETGWDAVN